MAAGSAGGSGAAPSIAATAGGAGSAGSIAGGTMMPNYGRRTIKVYSVSELEAEQLSIYGHAATALIGAGGFLMGLAIDLHLASVPDGMAPWWMIAKSGAGATSIACFLTAAFLMYRRGSVWSRIKRETVFES